MRPASGTTLLVWDRPEDAPTTHDTRVLWRAFAPPGSGVFSIPHHLEKRADVLRGRYLAWVRDLGREPNGGRSLADRLRIRPGFSFWWLSLLVEKSNAFNSPQIVNALKMFALEDMLGPSWSGSVVLATGDALLARAMRGWCRNASLSFTWRRATPSAPVPRAWFRRLPAAVRAFATLGRHLQKRWALRGAGMRQLRASRARVTFCSYLFNLDRGAAAEGRLVSAFWTELHNVLERESVAANWVFQVIEHDFVPGAGQARELIERFNGRDSHGQAYVTADSALGVGVALRALRDYLRVRLALAGRATRARFRPRDSALDMWPLFAYDWQDSLKGSAAMTSAIYLNLFERVLAVLPRQRLGFYLQENIGWEMAFIHAWKAAGHGRLVGVPHSTVRYWDLRYFNDAREYRRGAADDLPLPDLVALNGPAARAAFVDGGFPADRTIEVEALRYLHLAAGARPALRAPRPVGSPMRVLVLGDYMAPSTRQQMSWIEHAATGLPPDVVYTVKPHPACPVNPADYPGLKFRVTAVPLDQILSDCDVVFTSNMTSAAVDAYSWGVPVVSVLDGEALNISPLRGNPSVRYVTNAEDLAVALRTACGDIAAGREEFFHLDRKLPRWRRLLELPDAS